MPGFDPARKNGGPSADKKHGLVDERHGSPGSGGAGCDRCGGGDPDCPQCAGRGTALRLCDPGPMGPWEPPPPVRLVREYKGPTVDALLDAGEDDLAALPDRLARVLDALGEGRLDDADAVLEEALGTLVSGPGHRRPRGPWRRWVLWAWLLLGAVVVAAGVAAAGLW